MPDCSMCSRPLGHQRRRCKKCGACEDCCSCYEDPLEFTAFTPAELGLDPEDELEDDEERPWRGALRRKRS